MLWTCDIIFHFNDFKTTFVLLIFCNFLFLVIYWMFENLISWNYTEATIGNWNFSNPFSLRVTKRHFLQYHYCIIIIELCDKIKLLSLFFLQSDFFLTFVIVILSSSSWLSSTFVYSLTMGYHVTVSRYFLQEVENWTNSLLLFNFRFAKNCPSLYKMHNLLKWSE